MLKRDVKTAEWRHDCLLGPENEQNHLKLARYQVTEEELRKTRKLLADGYCIVDRLTLAAVTFNDKKAKLLAKGIELNDSIKELIFTKCKIRSFQMEVLS